MKITHYKNNEPKLGEELKNEIFANKSEISILDAMWVNLSRAYIAVKKQN
jgi:hypothetical protein